MQLSNLVALLPLAAATVTGGVLPRDAAPGIYAIKVVNGTDQPAVKVGDLYYGPVTEITARGSTLDKRDSNGGTGRSFPNHNDYNICTNTWRNLLQNGGQLEGKTKYVIRNGVAELVGCNYNGDQWAPPPQTIDQFNGLMDAIYGAWNTGWVYSDPYRWTFWRDIYGAENYCANMS
ncbi:hypothetical protein B0T18DRAFT_489155 [Schizothecium vesticola]|uniref:Uncharacterized protein n=1 Tax=Schizothecium vesticola TaxID=314040 RepID=A0AA40K5F7_9PEZI|nr:hypothetical protein B0T18DRAFT_489155 [Schizothecium vesticola]